MGNHPARMIRCLLGEMRVGVFNGGTRMHTIYCARKIEWNQFTSLDITSRCCRHTNIRAALTDLWEYLSVGRCIRFTYCEKRTEMANKNATFQRCTRKFRGCVHIVRRVNEMQLLLRIDKCLRLRQRLGWIEVEWGVKSIYRCAYSLMAWRRIKCCK